MKTFLPYIFAGSLSLGGCTNDKGPPPQLEYAEN